MTETGQPGEITRLTPEERARKLALEKSYLQLVIRLMGQVGTTTRLDDTIEALLRNILNVIGGTNITLYYQVDHQLLVADVYGRRESLAAPDDLLVQQVFADGEPVERESAFADSAMQTPEFGKAYSWFYPLKTGEEIIGVFRLENLNLAMRNLAGYLPLFFNYTAQVLRNEIRSKSRLQQANEQLAAANSELRLSNARLAEEIRQRREAESTLLITQFAVDHASDCLFWIRADASFANVNDSTCRILGYSREELLGMTVFDVDPAFPREAWAAHWQEIKARKSFTIESRHRTKSGELFPVEVTLNYVEYEGAEYNFAFARDISERKWAEESLRMSREQLQLKLDNLLTPDAEVNDQELGNIIDAPAIQSLMEDFTSLTGLVTAILDSKGSVLVATGWQEICTKFHRIHPETAKSCTESDLYLSRNVKAGEYVSYKCNNGLWDVVTPLYIGGKHMGNIYTGQFFHENEMPDVTFFEAQAARYGFDKEAYLAALAKVPRLSSDRTTTLMNYLVKFTDVLSKLSYSNLNLVKSNLEKQRIGEELRRTNQELEQRVAERTVELETTLQRLRSELEERRRVEAKLQATQFAVDNSADGIFWIRPDGSFAYANQAAARMFGYSDEEFLALRTSDLYPAHHGAAWREHWEDLKKQGFLRFEAFLNRKDGVPLPLEITANYVNFAGQEYNCAFARDITGRIKAEAALRDSEERFQAFMDFAPFYAYVKDASLNHLFANKKTLELISGPKPATIRSDAFFAEGRARQLEEADRRILAGLSTCEELEYLSPMAGKEAWLKDIKFPITLSDGARLVGGVAVDITERKKAEDKLAREAAVNMATSELTHAILMAESIEEMALATLKKAQLVTESKFGYVGHIDQVTGFLVCPTMTHEIWEKCGVPGKSIVFDTFAGLWGWVLTHKKSLLTNDPSTDERSTGTPPGHIPVERFLSAPAFHGATLVGQIALANSARPYQDDDLHIVEHFAAIFALGIQRKQAEDELRRLNENLEQHVVQRTAEIEKKTAELERMNKLFVGRELRMIELKEKIKALQHKLTESAGRQ